MTTRKTSGGTGRKKQHNDEIERLWGGLQIVEATEPLRVFLEPRDIRDGVPHEPDQCAFSLACRRAFGSEHVLFLRTVAYVDLPLPGGARRVERFHIGPEARRAIANFDQNGVADSGGYTLKPPTPYSTLTAATARMRDYEAKRKAAGAAPRDRGNAPNPRGPRTDAMTLSGVRRGRGIAYRPA